MPPHDYDDSPLEKWIRERNMTTNDFVSMVGCSRPVIWKVKKGLPICPMYAFKIMQITEGKVTPLVEKVGGSR